MDDINKDIMESVLAGKLDKEVAIRILKALKRSGKNAEGIAVIGMALRFPSANTLEEYWDIIANGADTIRHLPARRKRDADAFLKRAGVPEDKWKYISAGFVDQVDGFDHRFFRLPPNEANSMDPGQRLFLQTAWQAIEDAGYGGGKLSGSRTGVYVGYATYIQDNYAGKLLEIFSDSMETGLVGNIPALLPSRISYLLDLHGPSMLLDTACSSSLVAVQLACQAIKKGECDMALAGGVRLTILPTDRNSLNLGIESVDNVTRTFDEHTTGAGTGEGIGVVLLKPLHKALADGDHIYAVIRGGASNQDGSSISLTAPNPAAQADVLVRAWKDAEINPEHLSYIEGHGSGTRLGDPIEMEGLEQAFSQFTDRKQFCAIGTVKTNIGHLNESAGIAGFIKAVLALDQQQIPPVAHFNRPNSRIAFNNSPVFVNMRLRPWEGGDHPRLCGVSSFGLSGTNCHLVLEEAPRLELTPSASSGKVHMLALSAKTPAALRSLVKAYADEVADLPGMSLEDVCFTANSGRGHYNYRLAFTVTDAADFRAKLKELSSTDLEAASGSWWSYGFHKLMSEDRGSAEAGGLTAAAKAELNRKVASVAEELVAGGKSKAELLRQICDLYASGADIRWEDLCVREKYRRVRLPTYPFEDLRCWVEMLEEEATPEVSTDGVYYKAAWRQCSLPAAAEAAETNTGMALVFQPALGLEGLAADLAAQLASRGLRVIRAFTGCANFGEESEHTYRLSDDEGDYRRLLQAVDSGESVTAFYLTGGYGAALASLSDLEQDQRSGARGLFALARAFLAEGRKAELIVAGLHAQRVTGQEQDVNPSAMTAFGLSKVVQKECRHLACKRVDMDSTTTAAELVQEWVHGKAGTDVGYRKGMRYEMEFAAVDTGAIADSPLPIRNDGLYVITGGAGGIGLEIAKYLATCARVNLALINRSVLVDRTEWDQFANRPDHRLYRKITALREIEALGSTVNLYNADVADVGRMSEIVDELRSKYGSINGVIHAAGLPQYEPMADREPNQFQWGQFAPKVYGTWVVDHVTRTDDLDFFMIFSSVATFFAAQGQAEYVAGNAFADSFAAWRNMQGKRTLAINWTTWNETGMSFEAGFTMDTIFKVVPSSTGVQWFGEILTKDLAVEIPNVLLGKLNVDGGGILLLEKSQVKLSPELQKVVDAYKQRSGRTGKDGRKGAKPAKGVSLGGKEDAAYTEAERVIAEICREVLGFEYIDVYDNFFELGAESVLLQQIHKRLDSLYPGRIGITDLFEYPSVFRLAEHIASQIEGESPSGSSEFIRDRDHEDDVGDGDIAIIGISARFPVCDSLEEYWTHIRGGNDLAGNVPASRLGDIERFLKMNEQLQQGAKLAEGAFLDRIDLFDYGFFRLSPREASLMDPHHRLALMSAWEAVEDAGYGGGKIAGTSTGVFIGVGPHVKDTYSRYLIEWDPGSWSDAELGNSPAALPGRVSYLMDLKGPSMVIDTACSSSLVAVQLAVQALRSGDCDMALAGSVKLFLLPITFKEGHKTVGIASADARTRTFDHFSDGTSLGEGVASVLLKPLKAALRDGDHIHAVIKGVAINQDGTSAGLSAPNPAAQQQVLLRAWEDARVDPETIDYIEAHGTGTPLGDPIEVRALSNAFAQFTTKRNFCALSSVKTNIGHLSECAGMAGLAKAVLALKHKELPPGINFRRPNEKVDFVNSALYVNLRPQAWETDGHPRRCGVSAFGIGGTNCHVVMEEFIETTPDPEPGAAVPPLLTLSARTPAALKRLVRSYLDEVVTSSHIHLSDVCYTANTGRGHYGHRLLLRATDLADLRAKLEALCAADLISLDIPDVWYGYHRVVSSDREQLQPGDVTNRAKVEMDREAAAVVDEFIASGKKGVSLLRQLGALYVKGANIPWEALYAGENLRKVSLPTYPFEENRCWIEPPATEVAPAEAVPVPEVNGSLFHVMAWRPEMAIPAPISGKGEPILLLTPSVSGSTGLAQQAAASLRDAGFQVFEAEAPQMAFSGQETAASDALDEAYRELLERMGSTTRLRILHMATLSGENGIPDTHSLDQSQATGMLSLYHLVRAFSKQNTVKAADILLVSERVYEVTGTEAGLNPQYASFFGLGKVVSQEYPALNVRCVDIDEHTTVAQVMAELLSTDRMNPVAYRNGSRFVQEMREAEPDGAQEITFQEGGLYLITGGTGGIGLSLARHMAFNQRVRLALVGRSPMPGRTEWDRILFEDADPRLCERIRTIREIEQAGSEVLCFAADVSREAEIRPVIETLRAQYGRIHGVIHSAGLARPNILIRKELDRFLEVVSPKVQGTWLIDHLTQQDSPDFFVMCSSVVGLTGEASQGDYVAANSFQDAYCAYRSRTGRKTLTVNWVAWRDVGMAVSFGVNVDLIFKALPTEVAVAAFERALNSSSTRVIIGEFNFGMAAQIGALANMLPYRISDRLVASLQRVLEASQPRDPQVSEVAVIEDGRVAILPMTTMSKLQKGASSRVALKGKGGEFSEVERKLAAVYTQVLGYEEINIHDSFFELGGDSILLARVHALVERDFPGVVRLTDLFESTSVAKLARFIQSSTATEPVLLQKPTKPVGSETRSGDVAIIGLALEMSGISSLDDLGDLVFGGADCLRHFPVSRRADTDRYVKVLRKYGRDGIGIAEGEVEYATGAYLDDVSGFDPKFFRLTPTEASMMDPSQRFFLEVAWRAVEDAGYVGKIEGTRTGIWVGYAANHTYQRMALDMGSEAYAEAAIGNMANMMSGRVSYLLNLRGPGMVIDTACSSSLVAVHQACQALRLGECDMVVAGGVKLHIMPYLHKAMQVGFESGDGFTRSFDEAASGSAHGEGVVALLLKPLEQAERDGDHIYAVVKGSAVNQDGRSMSLTAPNPLAQAEVLTRAWVNAGIDPEQLCYLEAHGTATPLGDPIELDALQRTFAKYTNRKQFCAIGSIKSNMGHLFECAGMAGILKAILILKHQQIPPTVHFDRPNQKIDFANSALYVNTVPRAVEVDGKALVGVSSFGLNGVNSHVVLEEYSATDHPVAEADSVQILPMSAKSEEALLRLVRQYRDLLWQNDGKVRLRDIVGTAATGRGHYEHRLALVVRSLDDLQAKIERIRHAGFPADDSTIFYAQHKIVSEGRPTRATWEITEKERAALTERVGAVVERLCENSDDLTAPAELSRLYVEGAEVDWDQVLYQVDFRRISLPGYPFERQKCWFEIPDAEDDVIAPQDDDSAYFAMTWREVPLPTPAAEEGSSAGVAMLIRPEGGLKELANDLARQLRQRGLHVLEALTGCEEYQQESALVYRLRDDEADYRQVLEAVDSSLPLTVFYLADSSSSTLADLTALTNSQHKGVFSLFSLARAAVQVEREMELLVVGCNVQRVSGQEETVSPSAAALFGFSKVMGKECMNLTCRRIDMDGETAADDLIREWGLREAKADVAYRKGRRYEAEFGQVDLRAVSESPLAVREDGVYVISGGAGGIGLEMAKCLAAQGRVKLALVNRSVLPDRAEWEAIATQPDHKLFRKIISLREIESLGAEVNLYAADVSNPEQMQELVAELRAKYGRINGVIHGAGLSRDELISARRPNGVDWGIMAPKVQGTWVLDAVTREDNPDFFVLFSSVATIFPTFGQAEYTAANSFQDAFAVWRSMQGLPTITINWTTWRETGMAFEHGFSLDTIFKVLPTAAGVRRFARALSTGLTNVLIGDLNYEGNGLPLLQRSGVPIAKPLQAKINEYLARSGKQVRTPRPARKAGGGEFKIAGRSDGNYTPFERMIARVWGEVLGFDEINIYDNYFELGGDSISGFRVANLLSKELGRVANMSELLTYSTVIELAAHFEESMLQELNQQVALAMQDGLNEEELAQMLKELEKDQETGS